MTACLPIRPAPAAFRISTASPILLHPSLFTVFRVVPTLVSHENDSQKTRVSSLAGMEVEPSTWYSSRVTLPSHDLAHWRLTSQPCLCSNHHSTWAHSNVSLSFGRKRMTRLPNGSGNSASSGKKESSVDDNSNTFAILIINGDSGWCSCICRQWPANST